MALNLVVNGTIYRYPEEEDTNWGQVTTNWAQAVTLGMLQKAGGSFPLTADVDFGANFGLVASYYKSRTSNIALTGAVRLAASDFIGIRNQANTADLPLSINVSNELTFDGFALLTTSYTGIVNANISAAAGIAFTKMGALTANRAPVLNSSGFLEASSVTSVEQGYISGVTSSIQTQLNAKLNLTGGTLTGSLLLNGNPSVALQAATKQYVDNAMLGLSPKTPAVAGTISAGTLATDFENGDTIDGVVLVTGDVLLIKDQADPIENGIYVVQASGAPVRSTEADSWSEFVQAYVLVQGGAVNGGAGFICTASPGGTVGVDDVNFIQFSSSTVITTDGEGIEFSGSQMSLELDGSTLTKSSAGIRVNATVISDIAAKVDNPMTTNGDLIVRAAGVPARIAVGTTGQLLTVVAGAPAWQTFNLNPTVVSVSGNTTLTSADSNKIYLVDTSAARTFTFPTPATGLNFTIKDSTGQCSTNNITMLRAATEQIEGVAATKVLQTNWGSWKFVSDGTNWFIVG